MKYHFSLVCGDWSGDGHDKRESTALTCNYSLQEVKAAYKIASEQLGVDVINDCCTEYEDCYISSTVADKLREVGIFTGREDDEDDPDEGSVFMWADVWVDVVMDVAKTVLKDLEWEEASHSDKWDVGGYGLFT